MQVFKIEPRTPYTYGAAIVAARDSEEAISIYCKTEFGEYKYGEVFYGKTYSRTGTRTKAAEKTKAGEKSKRAETKKAEKAKKRLSRKIK